MTNTDSELTSVKSRATSLETRMTDAEGDISEKVDTSTFNTLSQTVDGNSASITSMGTVLTNNGLTSSTNITNTVNTVSQTASGNNSKISQLTTTLGTNADGTTKAGDVVHRTSAIEQDVSSFKTTVSETYTTKEEFENLEIGGRNLLPTVEVWENGTWNSATGVHSNRNTRIRSSKDGWYITIEPSETYVLSRHSTSDSKTYHAVLYAYDSSGSYVSTDSVTAWITEFPYSYEPKTATRLEVGIRNSEDGVIEVSEVSIARFKLEKGNKATDWTPAPEDIETRVSSAESSIIQNANNIALKVSKDGVISSINQSAETVKIQASRVEIDGTAVFTAISDDVDDAITGKGYATTTQAQGYATTAKSEAISAAASDATNKANAAQTAATNAANTATDNKLANYSTTAQANELYDAKGAAADVQTNLNSARSWYAECTTAAATAAKVATITPATTDFELATGVVVNVKFSVTNTSAVSSLTLNVNGTGAKNIKTQRSNSLTNLANAGILYANVVIPFIYNGQYWLAIENYNSDTYNRVRWQNVVTILEKPTGTWRILCGTASGYKQVGAGISFDLAYPLLAFSNQPEANATADTGYLSMNGLTFSNTAAIQSGAAGKTIFLKGTVSGNTFTIDSTNVFTTVVPTSEDGAFYIPLGIMTSATQAYFKSSKDLYAYLDGRFRQVTPTEIMASQRIYYRSKVSGTVPKPTAWVTLATNKYNDTVSVGNDGWSTKVTPIAASKAENVDKYLYLYTCEQRKRLDGTVECTDVTLDENTTIIDGGNIITHTITAEQLNATSINASKSLTVGAMTDTAAATILNSNINVGGRNLLPMSDRLGASGTSSHGLSWSFGDDGWIALSGTIDTTSSFAPVFWGHTVSESAPDYTWPAGTYTFTLETTGTPLVYGLVRVQVYVESDASQYLDGAGTVTFTATNGIQRIGLYVNANADGETVNGALRYKLEKGTMSTDWTPAPEDTNDAIVNVASDISESLENMDGTLNDFANTLETQSADIGESINEVQDQLNALREDFESEVNAREQ